MKKHYTVQFETLSGAKYEYEFVTENIQKSILEYSQNKEIKNHKILSENVTSPKKMLLG